MNLQPRTHRRKRNWFDTFLGWTSGCTQTIFAPPQALLRHNKYPTSNANIAEVVAARQKVVLVHPRDQSSSFKIIWFWCTLDFFVWLYKKNYLVNLNDLLAGLGEFVRGDWSWQYRSKENTRLKDHSFYQRTQPWKGLVCLSYVTILAREVWQYL